MAIAWPESLVRELAERRCVVFLGAGASAACTPQDSAHRPPDWATFLSGAADLITGVDDKAEALRLLDEKRFLDAAQVVHDALNPPDFSEYVRACLRDPNYEPAELHGLVRDLDAKIVVTTNYDEIYESLVRRGAAAASYNVCRYYEPHLVNDLRSRMRMIVKAHGCVTDPTRIVLTRKQYFDARRSHPSFYHALDGLFLTNTLLFIGAGLNGDPDIELTLENSNISAPSVHPHYAVVSAGRHPSIVRAIHETYNVQLLEYAQDQHDEVVLGLRELVREVEALRATEPAQ